MERRLIEEKSIEHLKLFSEVSEEARKEKLGRPPINEMLYWWTRKPLIVGRAVTLLALAPSSVNIQSIKQLLGLGREKRAFNYTLSRIAVEKLAGNDLNGLQILDPFAGAGNLLFEASRLGLNCTLIDYNPVAYLIMKATFEYPAKYGERLAEDVKKYGEEVIERVREELGRFYERSGGKALHYLWCWRIKCPYCGQRFPLTNQMWLDKKRRIGYRVKPTENGDFKVELGVVSEKEGSKYTQKRGKAVCIKCGNVISYEHMIKDIAERRDKEMIAIVTKGSKGKDYEKASDEDKEAFELSRKELQSRWEDLLNQDLIPQESLPLHDWQFSRMENYGLGRWIDFFTERQLLLMCTILKTIKEVCSEISDKEYAKAIATYLGFMLCKHIGYNCIGAGWNTSYEKIAPALSFRSPRIIYNFAETNPFEKTSGSLSGMLNDVVDAVRFAANVNKASAKVLIGSSLHLQEFLPTNFDLIITDPPYMDDVAYAELSEFFYVWLVRLLKDYYPELPQRMPVEEDLVLSKGRFGGRGDLAMEFYKRGMKVSFANIYKSLKNDGLLVVFFAHSSTEAWNLLLEALRETEFRVVSSYAVHTESTENPLARGKTSFMSSIVLACRKVLEEKEAYFESLMPKVEESIRELIESLDVNDLLTLPITDLLIMAYGKVLEELTQYPKIKSYRADFQPNFENLIGDARDYIFREIVRKLTGSSPNILGSEASFTLIGKIFYRSLMPADEALKVTRAYGLNLDSLTRKGYAKKVNGGVEIKPFTEVSLNMKPEEVDRNNIYEQLLYLEKLADEQGAAKAKTIMQYGNFRPQELRSLINLLIKHYRLLINKGEELKDEEKKELQILEALSDVMREPVKGGTLDSYI